MEFYEVTVTGVYTVDAETAKKAEAEVRKLLGLGLMPLDGGFFPHIRPVKSSDASEGAQ